MFKLCEYWLLELKKFFISINKKPILPAGLRIPCRGLLAPAVETLQIEQIPHTRQIKKTYLKIIF